MYYLTYYVSYITIFLTIMLPLYLKGIDCFNLKNLYYFLMYFSCSICATFINIFYVISIASILHKFEFQHNKLIRILLLLSNNTITYTKIIAWKLILIFFNIKLGYIGYTIFLSALYCDAYIGYFLCITDRNNKQYLVIGQYTKNIIDYLRLSWYLHNKYCSEKILAVFFYCLCDEWLLLMFEYASKELTKIPNFNLYILDNFINTETITFIFQYNLILFIIQIFCLLFLHNYIKKKFY